MAEDKQIDLLKSLIENKEKIEKDIEEAKKRIIPTVNIINILGCAYDEVKNSSLLHNIFKIKFKYENKEIDFAKDFSEYIIKEKLKNDSLNINSSKIESYNEIYSSSEGWRKIDLLIKADNFEIIIENKIWADDQPNQLKDYYNNRINENKNNDKIKDNIFIVYLTRNRDKPKEISIDRELIEELENKNKICYLSHDDIAEWIRNSILNKYQFLKDEKFQLIYSALIQIAYNEKYISKKTEENKMELNEIKKYVDFNLLLKEENDLDKKVNELNKSIELFENVKKIIADKKGEIILENESVKNDIKYSVDVGNYLKEKGINGAILKKEEAIKRDIVEGLFSSAIEMPIIGRHNLKICLFVYVSYHIDINIYSDKGHIRDEVKKLKTEIEERIGKLGEFDIGEEQGEPEYVYYVDIDTTKEDCPNPEETAQKIIDLYNFLKEKITQ